MGQFHGQEKCQVECAYAGITQVIPEVIRSEGYNIPDVGEFLELVPQHDRRVDPADAVMTIAFYINIYSSV